MATKRGSTSGMKYYVSLIHAVMPAPSGKRGSLAILPLRWMSPGSLVMFIAKYTATASPSAFGISPDGGDKVDKSNSDLISLMVNP
mgnify:CR=1 FL=1